MTKNIVSLITIFSSCLYGMETISLLGSTKNSLSLVYNKTKIHLTKESLSSAANRAEYAIVGSKQQELLSGKFEAHTVGSIYNIFDNFLGNHSSGIPIYDACTSLYEKNKDDDSASDDDTYNPYPYNPGDKKKQLWKSTYQKTKSYVKNIAEPCISQSDESFIYYAHRKKRSHYFTDVKESSTFIGDKAIQETSKDLKLCYREILRTVARYISTGNDPNIPYTRHLPIKNTSVVIPALSVDVGFPRDIAAPIAITTIFDFLKEYPDGYDDIFLVVKKRSDFARYKLLLLRHSGLFLHNIYLLSIAHTNNEGDFFASLPKELITLILQLMFKS